MGSTVHRLCTRGRAVRHQRSCLSFGVSRFERVGRIDVELAANVRATGRDAALLVGRADNPTDSCRRHTAYIHTECINIRMALDLEKINDSDHLLDMLIQIEDVLDSLDVFCYANWFDGEIIEGPIVRRYWVTVSILYPNDKMPDPRAALRLLKHGVQVEFDRMQRAAPQAAPGQEQASPTQ